LIARVISAFIFDPRLDMPACTTHRLTVRPRVHELGFICVDRIRGL